ncbi:hypothetical protein [Pseudobacteriovorax antillogorgiicola]|uniref:PilZ domain-containing protein n=1 Tax=Pseudobacteriovorax antillogorgiicola TaxID=1513793 RepID=A0A1Y6BVZ8_9BACT|nr:hypothetical protein [Pseudobacteriovorax antillogorgiicola]TCS52316.1 hypothetical protein EDD56_10960 [Pseudobacteriovorax antillogorgiicola]SMF30155.1 hypothetical protein SAMN06296036_109153 [Pseudobacteriovorax antillogorgiicola]
MGFNRQRPESLNTDLKRISIEFCDSGQDREKQVLADYINKVVYGTESTNVNIDDWRLLSSVERSTRKHQRVKFSNCFIQAITIKATNSKVIKIKAELIDLSVGGACIAIPEALKVIRRKKGDEFVYNDEAPNIKIKFDFIGDVVLKGIIRNLKKPKMDPTVDLDNFDFEYVLPQYWKVNG